MAPGMARSPPLLPTRPLANVHPLNHHPEGSRLRGRFPFPEQNQVTVDYCTTLLIHTPPTHAH